MDRKVKQAVLAGVAGELIEAIGELADCPNECDKCPMDKPNEWTGHSDCIIDIILPALREFEEEEEDE